MSLLDAALQGMGANMAGIAVHARNIANLNTEGYRAQRYDAASGRGVEAEAVTASEVGAFPQVHLAKEFVGFWKHSAGFRTSHRLVAIAERTEQQRLDMLA